MYGGTSGAPAHLFRRGVSRPHRNRARLRGGRWCDDTAAVCCGAVPARADSDDDDDDSAVPKPPPLGAIAFVNGPRGGRAIGVPHLELAEDWIQECGLREPVLKDLGECVPGEPVIIAAGRADTGKTVVGITTHQLIHGRVPIGKDFRESGSSRSWTTGIGQWRGGFGEDDGGKLWQFDSASSQLRRSAIPLPKGDWSAPFKWSNVQGTDINFTADAAGQLFSFDGAIFRALGKTPLAPVGVIAATPDGRLFGFCGDEMANMFCCDVASGKMENLGVAASVLEQRRYGYQFSSAVTGPDGEIVFGEDDNGGHLWLYFPKLRAAS